MPRLKLSAPIFAITLLSSSGLATADNAAIEDLTDLSIEELLNVDVISASRLGQKASQAPSSVSVLTATDIRTFGWRTLADALNAMPGLFTTNDRNYSFLGVRGFIKANDYNSRVLIMIDGQRMNENIYDTGNIAQEFMLDMDLVERIEFIPGSGSSIYGANAFLGLINVITKKGKAINGVQLAGDVGSFDTYKGRVSYGKQFGNGADVLVSASHYDSGGVENLYFPAYDTPATNNGIAHNMDAERTDRLFGRVQFKEFTLSGGFVDRFKRVPTAAYGQIFNDPGNYTVDKQVFGNLKYEKSLDDKTTLLLSSFFQDYEYHAEDAYDFGERIVTRDKTSGSWWGGDAQLTTRAFDRHRLILGVEYQYDQRQFQKTFDIDPYYLYGQTNRNGHRVEAYLQDDIQLTDELIFSAGLRFDYHHMIKHMPLNPRLGLIWNPLVSTTFKLLYSSTFRAPNAAELDYNNYYFSVNPPLHEERIKSYEGIVEWRAPEGLKLSAALFYNDISQLLEANEATNDLLANSHSHHIYGAEWTVEKRWYGGRLLKASHTYSRVDDEGDHSDASVGLPHNIFKLHYAEPLFNNTLQLGVENIYIDQRLTWQGGVADAYDLVNINLRADRIIENVDLLFGVYNLFDSRYEMLGNGVHEILPMNGREFRLKLQLTL